jgi:hypothetical protein
MLLITLLLAVAAFTYSEILTTPDMLLGKIFNYLERILPLWLFKPLIGCSKCVAGQWSLWLFLFLYSYSSWQSIIIHGWFVMQSIFNTAIIRGLYYKLVKDDIPAINIEKRLPDPPELNS